VIMKAFSICLNTPEFRSQITANEYAQWRRCMRTFLLDLQGERIRQGKRWDVSERVVESHLWLDTDCPDILTRISDFDVGYCMALGFNPEGIRQGEWKKEEWSGPYHIGSLLTDTHTSEQV
jgi:hypothetical protein